MVALNIGHGYFCCPLFSAVGYLAVVLFSIKKIYLPVRKERKAILPLLVIFYETSNRRKKNTKNELTQSHKNVTFPVLVSNIT